MEGCDVCGSGDHQTGGCQLLNDGIRVGDAKCPTRALLTVPSNLRVKTVTTPSSSKITIQARENVSINTRFGPLEAPPIVNPSPKNVSKFPLKLFDDDGGCRFLDTTDERHCNWMCLVRPARSHAEHNLNALQLSDGIYFLAKRNIRIHEELCVWYAPNYGRKIGFHGPPWSTPDESAPEDSAVVRSALRTYTRKPKSRLLPMAIEAMDSPDSTLPRRTSRKRTVKVWKEYVEDTTSDSDVRSQQSDKVDPVHENATDEVDAIKKQKCHACLICNRKFKSAKFLENHELRFHRDQQMVSNIGMLTDDTTATFSSQGGVKSKADPASCIKAEDDDCEHVSVIIMDDGSGDVDQTVLRLLQDGDNIYVPNGDADESNVIDDEIIASGQILMEAMQNADIMDVEESRQASDIPRKVKQQQRLTATSQHDAIQFDCPKCGKSFTDEAGMSAHACENTELVASSRRMVGKTRTACRYCERVFGSDHFLKRHVAESAKGRHKCRKCGRIHCTKKALQDHICPGPSSKSDGLFICKICHKSFMKMKYLEKHMPVHTGSHTCDICGKWLRSRDSLVNHKRMCGQVKELQENGSALCPQCKQSFTDLREFRRHFYEHTHLFPCDKCGARFRNKELFECHLCRPVSPASLVCEVCDEIFASLADLETHQRKSHATMDPAVDDSPKAKADTVTLAKKAGKTGKCQEKVAEERTGNDQNLQPFPCKLCGSLLSSKSSLTVHMRIHGEKQYECEICGKRFHRKDMLADHSTKHGEASIPCPICQKLFKTKKSLEIHRLLHDGRKRFSCQTCGKKFFQRINLTKHEVLHKDTPRQKWSCPSCPKQFSTKEYVAIHILEHSEGRKYTCDECGKGFVKEHQLKAHEKMLHTNQTYKCEFCGRIIKLKHSLKRHLAQKHPDQTDIVNSPERISEMLIPAESLPSTRTAAGVPRVFLTAAPRVARVSTTAAARVRRVSTKAVARAAPPLPPSPPAAANTSVIPVLATYNDNFPEGDGEVLLAVTDIESDVLQRALASGAACIRPGTAPNTIEISLPMEHRASHEFTTVEANGDASVGPVQLISYTTESQDMTKVIHHPYEFDDDGHEDNNVIPLEDAQSQLLDDPRAGDESTTAFGNTIIVEGGTLIQQGTSEDGSNVLICVLASETELERNANDLRPE